MAGAKGKSGGARPNTGGARPGAGRKKAPAATLSVEPTEDPLVFLLGVMKDPGAAPALRVRSAIAAAQYKHTKRGDGGKREGQADAAGKVAKGKFAPAAPPKLIVNNR